MGWRDTFGLVGSVLNAAPAYRQREYRTFEERYRPRTRSARSTSQRNTWSDMATGRSAPERAPASAPERINVSLPYSSTGARSPYEPPAAAAPVRTQGDLFASIGGSVGDLVGPKGLNLGNAVPFFMERVNVLAGNLAESDIPVASDVARFLHPATDAFIDGVEAVAKPVGQVLDAFPTWVRDSQLSDRAKLYRAIANGETPDYGLGPVSNPIATLGQLLSLVVSPTGYGSRLATGETTNQYAWATGQTVSEQASLAKYWQDQLLHSVDPERRLEAERRMALLRESIDLPESVKLALERRPSASDDDIERLLNEAPEGKQWSYRADPSGVFQNMATPIAFWMAEAKGASGLLGAAGASSIPGVATGANLASRGISLTAKLQTAAAATGLGVTATTTTMGAIARFVGADDAVAWFDKANRSTEFSDDPYVQLATGFAVNPFAAAGMAKKGVVRLKHGLVDVPVGAVMGNRLTRFYDSTSVIEDMTRRMFKLGSNDEARVFLDEHGLRDTAADRILSNALDVVLEKLPKEERLAWNAVHSDPVERAGATLQRYGQQALDLIEKDPDLVAARFHSYDWQYRMMPGPFEPNLAAKIALDHRHAVDMTYDLRAQQNLVVGYREFLPPKGQALARARVAEAVDDAGNVPMRVLQELVADFPSLRKEWGGLVKSTDATIPRATVDSIIDAAHVSWQNAVNRNPVRVATGVDPVIRPSSPTRLRDTAEALGTSIDTLEAFERFDPKSNAHADLLRRLLVDKGVMDEAAAARLSPDDAYARAGDYIDETTAPWEAAGRRLEAAEGQMARLRAELARVRRDGGSASHDITVRIQRDINELADLIQTAGDPIRTFASGAPRTVGPGDSHLAELAARKVDAMERLRVIETVQDELSAVGLNESALSLVVRGADGELAWAYDLLGDVPQQIADGFVQFRTANMYVVRRATTAETLTRRRQTVRELSNKGQEFVRFFDESPGSYKWAQIAQSPGFVKRLREIGDAPAFQADTSIEAMTGNQMADIVEAAGLTRGVSGEPIADIAARMTERGEAAGQARLKGALGGTDKVKPGREAEAREANLAVSAARGGTAESGGAIKGPEPTGVTPQQALERLAQLKSARDAALDGKGVTTIKRTAGIKVADDYVAQAEADRIARDLVYDAEYDAFWHPRNVAKVQEITANPDELYPGLADVVAGDAALEEGINALAARLGVAPDDLLTDPAHASAVRSELVPAGFEPPIEGLIREWTPLDNLITAGDADGIAALAEQLATSRAQPRPSQPVTERVARLLAQMPKKRRSYNYRRQISDAHGDFKAAPADRILTDAKNRIGLEVLSVMNHGITGTKPATVDGVIALLRDIENGAATRIGIGPELQAEAQRVARAILDDAVRQAQHDPAAAGTFSSGFFPEDETALAQTLDDLLSFDRSDPMGTLQYGLKKAPTDAVVMEWAQVPGLAEELLSKRFQPWEERIATTKAREAFNWIFGPRSNATARLEVRNRFVDRATRYGVSQTTANAIWERWAKLSHDSRRPALRKTQTGERRYEAGDNPLYADVWNLPNELLDAAVHGDHTGPGVLAELIDPRRAEGAIPLAEAAAAGKVNWANVFREAASTTRRTLADRGSLGKAIADAYGLAAHNRVTTTLYYWFRFGLDVRYHAMNYLEAQILYMGRAGLRKGEIDEGLLGMSEGYLRKLDLDPSSNTGYQFSRDRMAWAYRTFLKEQPDALRSGIRSVMKEGPEGEALVARAIRELVESDPQLRDVQTAMNVTPERYLTELDAWHRRMLNNVDEANDGATIDAAMAQEMAGSPALSELFDRLGQVNRDLWSDIRGTFYGNPNRSRAERVLNSYLLFWPLSYQIKSIKWFSRVLFDRAGGLQTNALGAIALDDMADAHNRLLATDPEYKDWFEKHETLVFTAQMLFPVSFDQMGVSLNPILRGLFFDRDILRAGEIGPVYTYNRVIRPVAKELQVDLFPTLDDYRDQGNPSGLTSAGQRT